MPFLILRGVRYHYLDYRGAETGAPTLVMLHGFTGCGTNGLAIARQLRARVIAPDLLGHGQTGAPGDAARYRMEEASQDVAELIRQVSPGAPVNLLGYSMGGRLALHVALTQPGLINKLILESASPGLNTSAERTARVQADEALAAKILRDGIEKFVADWEALPLFATQRRVPAPVRQALHAQRLQNNAVGLANSLRGMGTGAQPSLWASLSKLQVPTLLCAGEEDAKFVQINKTMAEMLPQATLKIFSKAGHAIHLEQPEVFGQAVQAWQVG